MLIAGFVLVGIGLSCSCPTRTCKSAGDSSGAARQAARERPFGARTFAPFIGKRWIGNGISYGPFRDGQTPDGGPWPSKDELREDLHLLSKHWSLLRMYGSRGSAEMVLQVIHEEQIPMKVLLGAWVATEARLAEDGSIAEEFPDTASANRAEVETAIKLANAYPDVVIAVNVGNETQVSWSFHKVRAKVLVDYIRRARAQTNVPVTTADDFSYWNTPESKQLAREVDFIVMHAYAMWWGQPLENAVAFTQEKYAEVAALHPDHRIVIGEAGWATRKHSEGEQARLIAGVAGEEQQKLFYNDFIAWTTRQRIANFYFEAFDENWKGGAHPDEVEKHWGLFRADRTPKLAMEGRP
jgi:exo-beta-1,3-glucanase (GH17 family)